tara:strand:- start:1018 stop:1440 length:423 start_codon:yes stop_codon:yes gene_type:complete
MELPTHVVGYIAGFADGNTQMCMGCTCRELRPLISKGKANNGRVKARKLISNGTLRSYGIITDWCESLEHPEEWLVQRNIMPGVSVLMTMWCLYDRKLPPRGYHRNADTELYDILVDEMKIGCPDIALLYSFWLSVTPIE